MEWDDIKEFGVNSQVGEEMTLTRDHERLFMVNDYLWIVCSISFAFSSSIEEASRKRS